jgi:hypothetical protein
MLGTRRDHPNSCTANQFYLAIKRGEIGILRHSPEECLIPTESYAASVASLLLWPLGWSTLPFA